MQSYFNCDFYTLVEPSEDFNRFIAYQLDDASNGRGFFAVFRPEGEPSNTLEISLHGLSLRTLYSVTDTDGKTTEMKGNELAKRIIVLPKARTCLVTFYEKKKRK